MHIVSRLLLLTNFTNQNNTLIGCSCSWVIESDTVPAIMQRVPIDGGACKVHRLSCPTNKKDHKSTQSEELLSQEPIPLESDLLETRCLAGFAFALAATTAG